MKRVGVLGAMTIQALRLLPTWSAFLKTIVMFLEGGEKGSRYQLITTEVEVKQYFSELTKAASLPSRRTIPGKGDIYVVSTPEGNFTLRNFSSSSGQTGPTWTIDVPKTATGTTYNPEIKFLKGRL